MEEDQTVGPLSSVVGLDAYGRSAVDAAHRIIGLDPFIGDVTYNRLSGRADFVAIVASGADEQCVEQVEHLLETIGSDSIVVVISPNPEFRRQLRNLRCCVIAVDEGPASIEQAVRAVTTPIQIFSGNALVAFDFADMPTMMPMPSHGFAVTRASSGETRARDAARAVMATLGKQINLKTDGLGCFLLVNGDSSLTLREIHEVNSCAEDLHPESNVVVAGAVDEMRGVSLTVTGIVVGRARISHCD